MAGRGSFIESFPLFGYDLDDYDELFAEKLELLLGAARGRAGDVVGPPSRAAGRRWRLPAAACRTPLPVWVAVGGTPQSVVRAATLGLPLALAIIGGLPERFAPLAELLPHEPRARPATTRAPPLSINSTATSQTTARRRCDEFFGRLLGR